jgi:hypothetical protein
MWYVIDGFILYFGVIAAGYGFVWCTRRVSRWYHNRNTIKGFKKNLEKGQKQC